MLIRNEICEHLKSALEQSIQARILLDDIFIYDIEKTPLIVIKQKDTNISSPSSDSWKHTLELECEIITTNKTQSDEILESLLQVLETFKGIKNVTGISVEKVEIATEQAFSVSLAFEILYFTPSYKA